jgi:hypothetical protein
MPGRLHYSAHIAGPKRSNEQMATRTDVNLLSYPAQTFNFVPPLTFQSRHLTTKACEGFAASSLAVFEDQRRQRCIGYSCEDEAVRNATPVIRCFDDNPAALK